MEAPNSRFGAFLANYDKENKFIVAVTGNFFERIEADKNRIIEVDTGMLKNKFQFIDSIIKDTNKTSYDKALTIGGILVDVAPSIFNCDVAAIKKSGINVIDSFLNMAKETEDQQLLNNAMRIADSLGQP